MKTVSVIVPIYKGNKYIDNLIKMIDENCRILKMEEEVSVELVLVNDFPQREIVLDGFHPQNSTVRLISNKNNMGIHGSRINGLGHSNSEYIVFLDQDDSISSVYLREQFGQLEGYDAVVCNGIDQSLPIYKNLAEQQKVLDIRNYKDGCNYIVSPGQVLIKRSAIPKAWLKHILSHNGADDYYLWFLMLLNKCKMKINNQSLFLHTISDNNTSNDRGQMQDSVNEMLSYLKADQLLTEAEVEHLKNRREARIIPAEVAKTYNLHQEYMYFLDLWLTLIEDGKSPADYLHRNNMSTIAIYGMGMLGKHLERELRNTGIQVKYMIDQKGQQIGDMRCIPLGTPMESVDAVIVTPICDYFEIKENLEQYYNCTIISLNTIIKNMDVSIL